MERLKSFVTRFMNTKLMKTLYEKDMLRSVAFVLLFICPLIVFSFTTILIAFSITILVDLWVVILVLLCTTPDFFDISKWITKE